jgi:biotin transport system substrate-specific component
VRFFAALLFAAVTAVSARLHIPLWFTPVPVTLQVLAVVLSGLVLGSRWGAISQLQYLILGMLGLPVFTGPVAGPAALMGPTGGYLLGFVVGAYLVGRVFELFGQRTRLGALIAGVAGIAGIYAVGALWLCCWLGCTSAKPWSVCLSSAWYLGVVPFVGIDILKAVTASGIALGMRSGSGLIRAFRELGC